MKPDTKTGFLISFKCALEGLRYALHTQRNFRIHLVATLAVIITGLWLQITLDQWAVLTLIISLVMVVELLNTTIEVMVDLVSPNYHPLAKTVKDLAAGAVLLVAISAIVTGIIILGPPLWHRIFH
jgi:undecaprenol kinase